MLLKTQSRAGRKVFSFLMIDNGDKLDNLAEPSFLDPIPACSDC